MSSRTLNTARKIANTATTEEYLHGPNS